MSNEKEAETVIEKLNRTEVDGNFLSITYYEKAPNQLMVNKAEKVGDLLLKVLFIGKMSKDVSFWKRYALLNI